MEEVKKVITIQTQGAAKSVGDLRKEINQLRDAMVNLDSTSKEFNDLARQVAQREQQLQKVMSASKNVLTPYERSLKALTTTYANQRQELRALRTALENLSPETAEYRSAFERAAEITHDLQERQELLRMSSSDLGVQLGNIRDIGTGLAAGWSSVNALMTLTGNNSEDLQKVMVKLQAGIALVQGMQGMEGLSKAIKGYINGAAKWYDNIVNLISGNKTLATQTQATATATEALSTAEKAAATGAVAEAAGVNGVATAARAATVATTALKAALMSIGIGAIIAGITGLVSLVSKLAQNAKETGKTTDIAALAAIEAEDKLNQKYADSISHQIELAKLRGASIEEIQALERKRNEALLQDWGKLVDYQKVYQKIEKGYNSFGGIKNENRKLTKFVGAEDLLKVEKLEKRIQQFGDVSNDVMQHWSVETRNAFVKIKESGIKTFKDLGNAIQIWSDLSIQQSADATSDLLDEQANEREIKQAEITKAAVDGVKSEIQLLKEQRDADLANVKGHASAELAVRKYYSKQIWDIITGQTQSIIDNARQVNQTELQNLDERYKKQIAILQKYGRDTVEVEKAWAKERAKLQYKLAVDAYRNEESTYQSGGSTRNDYKEKLGAEEKLLAAFGLPSEKAVQARLDYLHDETKFFLEEQVKWWKKASEDTTYTEEDRNEAYSEYIKAQNKLTEENTRYYVESAQNRMNALNREVDNERKKMDERQRWNQLQNNERYLRRSGSSNAGQGLFQAFWGGDNPSFKQMRDDLDAQYEILKAGLDAQIALYKKAAYDKNLTDEERAAAKKKWLETEAELDMATAQHTQVIAENYKDMWETTLDAGVSVMQSFSEILGSVADTMEAQVQRQLELGEITEEQAEEQRKKIKAIQIAQAVVSTISGAIGAFTQASATIPPPAGQIVGGVAAAAVIAAGIASIAQMKATDKNTNSVSSNLPIASPSMAGFEKDYEANMTGNSEVSALRNAIEGADIRAYVVESDITSAQNRSRRRSSESTF